MPVKNILTNRSFTQNSLIGHTTYKRHWIACDSNSPSSFHPLRHFIACFLLNHIFLKPIISFSLRPSENCEIEEIHSISISKIT